MHWDRALIYPAAEPQHPLRTQLTSVQELKYNLVFIYFSAKSTKPREQRPLVPQRKARIHTGMAELRACGGVVETRQSSWQAILWMISIKTQYPEGSE